MTARRRRGGASLGLNLTPLIDIVFLLLVFFMLTAHFVEERTLAVELPEARTSGADGETRPLTVTIGPRGGIRLDGEAVAPKRLAPALRRHLAGDRRLVRVRGDRQAAMGRLVKVMDAARAAGAGGVAIAARARP